jgi:hypothetical protein
VIGILLSHSQLPQVKRGRSKRSPVNIGSVTTVLKISQSGPVVVLRHTINKRGAQSAPTETTITCEIVADDSSPWVRNGHLDYGFLCQDGEE